MEDAPLIGALPPIANTPTSKAKIPTVSLIACGGCGINIVSKLLTKHADPTLVDRITTSAVDTSEANMTDLHAGIKPFMLAEEGSGKIRSTHIKKIQHCLDTAKIPHADINIVVFSMSGGSGSVLGPLIARHCAAEGLAVILVGVVDDQSRQDCMNSISTLKTMESYCQEDKLYFPTMLYSNMGTGRFVVNATAGKRLNTLIEMFISRKVDEIDFKDKMNFLQPHKSGNATIGVYSLNVTDALGSVRGGNANVLPGEVSIEIDNGVPAHASITIDDIGSALHKFSNVSFVGYSETEKYYAVIGTPLDPDLLKQLQKTASRFATSEGVTNSDLTGQFAGAGTPKSLLVD